MDLNIMPICNDMRNWFGYTKLPEIVSRIGGEPYENK